MDASDKNTEKNDCSRCFDRRWSLDAV